MQLIPVVGSYAVNPLTPYKPGGVKDTGGTVDGDKVSKKQQEKGSLSALKRQILETARKCESMVDHINSMGSEELIYKIEEGLKNFEEEGPKASTMNPGNSEECTGQSSLKLKISELEKQLVEVQKHHQESTHQLEQVPTETKQKWEKNDQQQQGEIDRLKKELERKDTEIASYQIQTKTKHEEVIQLQKELGQKHTESSTYQSELRTRQEELELARKEGVDLRLAADKLVIEHQYQMQKLQTTHQKMNEEAIAGRRESQSQLQLRIKLLEETVANYQSKEEENMEMMVRSAAFEQWAAADAAERSELSEFQAKVAMKTKFTLRLLHKEIDRHIQDKEKLYLKIEEATKNQKTTSP